MKKLFISSALIVSLCLSSPAFAQEVTPASAIPLTSGAPATPQSPSINTAPENKDLKDFLDSPLWEAYFAALKELGPILNPGDNIKAKIEHLDGFEFSTETRKKFFDLFGNDNPLHMKSKKLGNGNTDFTFVLDSLDYLDPKTGSKTHTSALTGKAMFNKSYNKVNTNASMPSINFDDGKSMQVTAHDLSLASNQAHGYSWLWFGTEVVKLDHLAIDNSTPDLHLNFDGMSMKENVKKHGKLVDFEMDFSLKSVNWGNEGLGPVHMALRLSNIDGKKFADINEDAKNLDQAKLTQEERVAAVTGMLRKFGLATLNNGASIDIQDISVKYHDMTAGLNGRITFNNVQSSDFESQKLIWEKVVARINVRVPMALVIDISRVTSRNNLEQQNIKNKILNQPAQPVTDDAVNMMAKAMVDNLIGKLLQEKLVQIKHDTLLSTIEIKQGKFIINGKEVPLPETK